MSAFSIEEYKATLQSVTRLETRRYQLLIVVITGFAGGLALKGSAIRDQTFRHDKTIFPSGSARRGHILIGGGYHASIVQGLTLRTGLSAPTNDPIKLPIPRVDIRIDSTLSLGPCEQPPCDGDSIWPYHSAPSRSSSAWAYMYQGRTARIRLASTAYDNKIRVSSSEVSSAMPPADCE